MRLRHVVRGSAVAALLLSTAACGKKTDGPAADATTAEPAPVEPAPTEPAPTEPAPTDPAPAEPAPTEPAPADPAPAEPAPASAELVERGRFIAELSGCMLCHTQFGKDGPVLDKAWGGGLEIPEAFGTWRSPNISQHPRTGIGGWTDEEIDAAVRRGVRPDGSQLYPVMPYMFYNGMSDDDAKALVAFLRTVPAVDNAVAGNTDLKMPKIPVPAPAGKPPADDPVAQGAYYATLMHCAACHTPMTETGPDMTRPFAGGMPFELPMFGEGVLFSANLTSDKETGLGNWTDAEIATAIRGTRRDGHPILPPMALYAPVWSKLPDAEIAKIVAFLRTLPPTANAVPPSTFKPHGPPPGADGAAPAPDAPADEGGAEGETP